MKKKLSIFLIMLMLLNISLFDSNIAFAATITSVPSISMPSSVNTGENITASWNSISGATGYLVALLDQTTGTKLINNDSTTSISYKISSSKLTAGHSYKCWVGVTNSSGTNSGSTVYFTVNESYIKTLPSISMPSSVNAGENITGSWDSISGATGYLVALLDQTTGTKPINNDSTTSTSYKISSSKLTAGHSYKFWVGATNSVGTNAGSAVYFTVNESNIKTSTSVSAPSSAGEKVTNSTEINSGSSVTVVNILPTPSVSITSPSDGAEFNVGDTIKITGTGTNCDHIALFIDKESVSGATINGNNYDYDYTLTTAGTHTIQLKGNNASEGSGTVVNSQKVSITVKNNETITNPLTTWDRNYIRYNPDTNEIEVELPISPDDKNNFYMTVYDENLQPLYGGILGEATYDPTTQIFPYEDDSRKYKGHYFTSFIPGCTPNEYSTQKLNLEYGNTYKVGIRTKGFESSMVNFTKELTLPSLIDGWNVTTNDNNIVINNSQLKNTATIPKFKCTINDITKDIVLSNTFSFEDFNLSGNKSYDVFLQIDDNGKLYEQQKIGNVEIQQQIYDSKSFWESKIGTSADDWCYPFMSNKSSQNNFGANRTKRAHAGIDLQYENNLPVGSLGDNVLAMTNGVVIRNDYFYKGTYQVVVLNDDGTIIRYTEISSSVKKGNRVTRGDVIGRLKTNSLSERSRMLHLEVYLNQDKNGTKLKNNNGFDLTNVSNNSYWYVSLPSSGFSYKRRADLIDPSMVTKLHTIEDFN